MKSTKCKYFVIIITAAIITVPSLRQMQQIQPILCENTKFFVPSRKCVITLWLSRIIEHTGKN